MNKKIGLIVDRKFFPLYCWIYCSSAFFAILGVMVAFCSDHPIFSIYNRAMAEVFFSFESLPVEAARMKRFLFAPLGTSIVGKWVLSLFIIQYALKKRTLWGYEALVSGLLSWFFVDSLATVFAKAYFNIYQINIFPLLMVGIPLFALRKESFEFPGRLHSLPLPFRFYRLWFIGAVSLTIIIGIAIAFLGNSFFFDFYNQKLAATFFPNGMPVEAFRLQIFLMGPIGGTTIGHMVMMLYLAYYAFEEKWVLWACLASILVWAIPDTILSFIYGANFNVWLINVPSTMILLPPLILSLITGRKKINPNPMRK